MPTCGDCIKNVSGSCRDTHTDGYTANFKVSPSDEACTEESGTGWGGYEPRTKSIEVRSLGQLLKEKIDTASKEETTCLDCVHFKGVNKDCDNLGGSIAIVLELKCGDFKRKDKVGQVLKEVIDSRSREVNEEMKAVNAFKATYYVSTPKKEEETMSNTAIIRLADSQLNKEIEDFGGLSLDIREALTNLQAEERKQSAQDAAKVVMQYLKDASDRIEDNVDSIRSARRQEEAAKKSIDRINRAKAYGLETNNFVPLGVMLGRIYEHNVDNKDLLKIPEGWEPKKAEVK